MNSDFPLENLFISYRSQNETIQMKATAYYFLVVLFRLIKCNFYSRYYYLWVSTGFLAGRLGAAPTFWYREQETSTRRLLTFYTTICTSLIDIQDTHQQLISLQNLILRHSQTCSCHASLRKQPTFGDATSSFPAKWRVRNGRRNSIPMTRLYPDMGSASDWSCRVGNLIQAIRRTTQIWVVTRHQYGISALVSKTSFGGETSGGVAKCRLFSQATVTRAGF